MGSAPPACWPGQVINLLVLNRVPDDGKPTLSMVPQGDLMEFWLPLTAFDISSSAKNGCQRLSWLLVALSTCFRLASERAVQIPLWRIPPRLPPLR